jgi:hypothetical protein
MNETFLTAPHNLSLEREQTVMAVGCFSACGKEKNSLPLLGIEPWLPSP